MNAKSAFNIVKGTVTEFSEDNVLRLSAALAYYAMFSIGPLLAIVVGVVGLAFGHESVQREIHHGMQGMLGENSAKTLDSMMAARSHGKSIATTIIGVVVLLFGAAGVFGQLQDSLNTIWEVKTKPKAGIWAFIRNRFFSFSMVLGVAFLLLVSLAISTALAAFTGALNRMVPMGDVVGHIVDFIVSFGIVTLLFAMIFKFLPDVRVPWRKIWIGAIGTALLFTLGKFLLGLYLGRQSTASAYGAAGSVIVILMWVYYASVILFFGAEFTQVYAKATGTKITPAKYAVPVTEKDREEQGIPRDKTGRQGTQSAYAAIPGDRERVKTVPRKAVQDNGSDLILLMFITGVVAGGVFKSKLARKLLKLYLTVA